MNSREKIIQKKILSWCENRQREGKLFYFRSGAGNIRIPESQYTSKRTGIVTTHRARMFKTGKKGLPDIFIMLKGNVIFAEVKDEAGVVSEDQKKMHKEIEEQGGTVLIVRDEYAFVEFMDNLLGKYYV